VPLLHPSVARDALLFLFFLVAWLFAPRATPLDRTVRYIGTFEVIDSRTLKDSLGQTWHATVSSPPGTYVGEVTFWPFEAADLPFVFQAQKIYRAKGMLGEARVMVAQQIVDRDEPILLKKWRMQVEKLAWSTGAKALLHALVLGQAREIPIEIRTGMQRLGLAHLTAVSGFHLGLLWGVLGLLSRLFPWEGRPAFKVLGLGALWAYVALIGYPLSAVRAAVMLSLLALVALGPRRKAGLRTLGYTVAGMLLFQPEWLQDVGFQLSVSAVTGIVVWMKLPLPRWGKTIGLSVAAQFATLWVALPTFHQFPWFFLPANLLLTPLVLLLYPYALLAVIGQVMGLVFPFPECALEALAGVPEHWVFHGGYLSASGRWALQMATLGSLYGVYRRWWILSCLGVLAAVMVLVESGPMTVQERTWHQQGRGLAQVEIRGDTALIQGTKGFLSQAFYWDKKLEGYFDSRGVKHRHVVPVPFNAVPEALRQWGDSTQSKVLWRLPRRKKRTSATD
jgi:ComEC/Rec2-related protein